MISLNSIIHVLSLRDGALSSSSTWTRFKSPLIGWNVANERRSRRWFTGLALVVIATCPQQVYSTWSNSFMTREGRLTCISCVSTRRIDNF